MSPADDASLGFQEVRDRFVASASALSDIRGKVDELSAHTSRQAEAVEALDEASREVAGLAEAARVVVDGLAEAQGVIVEAFAAVQPIMDGSDLREIKDDLTRVNGRLAKISVAAEHGLQATAELLAASEERSREEQSRASKEMADLIKGLRSELSTAGKANAERDAAQAQASELQGQLERLKAAAGGRAIKKAGLE